MRQIKMTGLARLLVGVKQMAVNDGGSFVEVHSALVSHVAVSAA